MWLANEGLKTSIYHIKKKGSLILEPLRFISMRSQWEFGYHISSTYFFSSVIVALLDVTSRKKWVSITACTVLSHLLLFMVMFWSQCH